ncbi:kinase domain-containing protein [Lojkania enalia]|uniref:Kinase domain-containing protein n=1 Tax=Lojkania enalia TaxID=147567 RepID=A0A9P4KEG1_9PLEO|nr:kinase domain-containing protein [Didymosphaeria enalia]
MTARTLTNVVNDQTVALNAFIFGYAGHSLVTPHAALQQVWWTEERINEKVTREFITSRLQPNERRWLERPVGFGDLTDDTYIDWILERARRLFLVLAEVGEADKIFTVVEHSWDDDDLPLQMEDIEQLSLSNKRDDQVNIRFYHTQFTYLLRVLSQGVHIDYAPNEVLPLEYVMGLPPAVTLQHWSRVHLPKKPREVYVRRKFPLGNAECPDAFESDFLMDVESAKMVEHEHIAPVWASYTLKGTGYTLSNFVGQHTLKTYIEHRNPPQYQRLPKPERRYLLLGWLHCLADAVATLHQNGFCHSSIRPSTILIDDHNNIAFSDIDSLETFQKDKKPDPMEIYIYSAPEVHISLQPLDAEIAKPTSGRQPSRHKLTKVPTNDFSGFNFGFKRTKPAPKLRSRIHETEKADVFSLGCIFLDILTFMLKKKTHEFVKHRSSKQKIITGGKNSKTDSSFHANLERIDTWIKVVEDASFQHEEDAFRAVPHIMILIRGMLSRAPVIRPTARDVRDRLLDILIQHTAIPNVHCGAHIHDTVLATTSLSGSDQASTMTSSRASMSTISTDSSDADTIRFSGLSPSTRVSSILNSYSDRSSTLSDISELDDGASISTLSLDTPHPPPFDTRPCSPRGHHPPIASPISPRLSNTPSFAESTRPSSPTGSTRSRRSAPWNKPFILLP